jgi:hypothetical protein
MYFLNIDYGMADGVVRGFEFCAPNTATIGAVQVPRASATHMRLQFSKEPIDDRPQIQRYDKEQDVLMVSATAKPQRCIIERLSDEVIIERTDTTIEAVYIFGIGESPTIIVPPSSGSV